MIHEIPTEAEQATTILAPEALAKLTHIETGEATARAFDSLQVVNPDAATHFNETVQARATAATELVETGGKLHERSVLMGKTAPRISKVLDVSTDFLVRRLESSSRSGDEGDVTETLRRAEQTTAFFAELARGVGVAVDGDEKVGKMVHIGSSRASFDLESFIRAVTDVQYVTGERIAALSDNTDATATYGGLTGSAGYNSEAAQALRQLATPLNGREATAEVTIPLGYDTSARVVCASDGGDRSRDQFQVWVVSAVSQAERAQQLADSGSLVEVLNSHAA